MNAADGSGAMFDGIASRYDLLNRILSLGLDRGWRQQLVDAIAPGGRPELLDLATGTADVAIAIARRVPGSRVVGVDPSEKMLAVGRSKVDRAGLASRIELRFGDGGELPFADGRFDGACIAFGIRNVPGRRRCLAEMARVCRAGARVAVLELGEPRDGPFGAVARFHLRAVVPRLGALLSGSREYAYLQRSVAAFPPPEQFAETMKDTGLIDVIVRRLTFGAAHIYSGRVCQEPVGHGRKCLKPGCADRSEGLDGGRLARIGASAAEPLSAPGAVRESAGRKRAQSARPCHQGTRRVET